jgi:hypothetical protein
MDAAPTSGRQSVRPVRQNPLLLERVATDPSGILDIEHARRSVPQVMRWPFEFSRSPHPCIGVRMGLAAGMAMLLVVAGLLSASPALHEAFHELDDQPCQACLILSFGWHGVAVSDLSQPRAESAPASVLAIHAETSLAVPILHWRSPPGRGPPAPTPFSPIG